MGTSRLQSRKLHKGLIGVLLDVLAMILCSFFHIFAEVEKNNASDFLKRILNLRASLFLRAICSLTLQASQDRFSIRVYYHIVGW